MFSTFRLNYRQEKGGRNVFLISKVNPSLDIMWSGEKALIVCFVCGEDKPGFPINF